MRLSTIILLSAGGIGGYLLWKEWKVTEQRIQDMRNRPRPSPLKPGGQVLWDSSKGAFESPLDVYNRQMGKKPVPPVRGIQ